MIENGSVVLSRRRLLKSAAGAISASFFVPTAETRAAPSLPAEQKSGMPDSAKSFEESFLNTNFEEQSQYMKDPKGNLQARKILVKSLDGLVPLFASKEFKNFTRDQIQEDMNMYFDMYWAGWEKYNIPWYMLWIIHIQESTVSRDKSADTNGDGAMQVIRGNLAMPDIKEAPEGYRQLQEKTQRFSTRGGNRTTDSDEILRGAAYIRRFADSKRYEDDEKAILEVIEKNYSDPVYGRQRVRKIKQVKDVFQFIIEEEIKEEEKKEKAREAHVGELVFAAE